MTTTTHFVRAALAALLGLASAGAAQALSVSSFSPQGEVARVRQVVVKFDAAAVNFRRSESPRAVLRGLRRRCVQGHGSLDRRARVGVRLRGGPAARHALHGHRAAGLQVRQWCGPVGHGALPVQYRRPLRAERAPRHLPAHRRRAVLPAATERPGHPGEREGQRLVRGRGRGRAHSGAPHRGARSALRCWLRCAWRAQPGRRRCAMRRWPATAGSRRAPRCNWCTARAWPPPAGCPTPWSAATATPCANPSAPISAANARTRRRPACPSGRCACRSMRRCRAGSPRRSG